MRILLLTNIFPSAIHPHKGTFNLEMIRGLAKRHETAVICPIAWTEAVKSRSTARRYVARETVAGITAYYPVFYYPPKILRRYYAQCLWQSIRSAANHIVSEFPPDLVLGYWAHPDGTVAVRLARRLGIPGVVMVGGSDVLLFTRSRMRRRLIANSLASADAVITVGEELKDAVAKLGVDPRKLHAFSRGVDTSRFSLGRQDSARERLGLTASVPALLWVGRMVPVKGLDTLLRAAAMLRDRGLTFRIYLVGDGPQRDELQRQSTDQGLSSIVEFRGPCAHSEIADWFRAADITLLPSLSEGTPNVLLESMACGTRFVASAVGSVPSIAEPGLDYVVPPGDARALADAVEVSLATGIHTRRRPVPSAEAGTARLLGLLESLCGSVAACA